MYHYVLGRYVMKKKLARRSQLTFFTKENNHPYLSLHAGLAHSPFLLPYH
jgi:hypothetical protein